MKKIISFLLLAAMLVGCMIPAVITSAASGILSVEAVEKMEGTGAQVAPELKITGNPGVSSLVFVLVYEKADFTFDEDADAFAGTLFSTDDSSIAKVSNKNLANYIPEGASASDYEGKKFEVMTAYDEENDTYPDATADGIVAKLPLALANPVAGESYSYTIVVEEAYDADGEEADVALDTIEGTVTVVADPLIGIKDEFTLFFDPTEATVAPGTETVDVDVRIDANPGIWTIRCYIVHPAELKLVGEDGAAGVNGTVFADNAFGAGRVNLPLDDENQVKAFKDVIAAQGIETEGYVSSTFVWLPDDPLAEIDGNGLLMSLQFELPADAQPGDEYDIAVYTGAGDVFWAGTEDDGTTPKFVDYTPAVETATIVVNCEHGTTEDQHRDADCGTDGYDRTVCTICGEVLEEEIFPKTGNHTPGMPNINKSTCTVAGTETINCCVCGECISTNPLPLADHTPGAEADCKNAQTCTECGAEVVPALGHEAGDPDVTKATCTEDGLSVTSCTRCGEEISREVLTAPGHTYLQPNGTVITPPSCTEAGYTTKTCDVCGEQLVTDEVPAEGHLAGEAVVVEPTYYEDGSSTISCDECGEELSSEVLDRLTIELTLKVVDENGNVIFTDSGEVYIDDAVIYLDVVAEYTAGYTIVITEDMEIVENELFVYGLEEAPTAEYVLNVTANTDIVYTVYYVDAEGNEIADAKVVEGQTMATEVTEKAIEIEGYTADEAEITITLAADENAIVFTYTANEVEDDEDAPVVDDNKNDNNNSVQTGDNMMYIIIALAVVAIASCAVIVIRRKRSSN